MFHVAQNWEQRSAYQFIAHSTLCLRDGVVCAACEERRRTLSFFDTIRWMHWWMYRRHCRSAEFNHIVFLRRSIMIWEKWSKRRHFSSAYTKALSVHSYDAQTQLTFFLLFFFLPKTIVRLYGTRIVVLCELSPLNSVRSLWILLITRKSVKCSLHEW